MLVLARGLSDPALIPSAVASGGVDRGGRAARRSPWTRAKRPFADVYSAAVSLQNLLPRVPQRLLILAVAAVATGGAFAIDLVNYLTSCSCSARSSCRSSACCSPTGWLAGRTTASATSSRAPAVRPAPIARVARGLRALPVALAGRAELVDEPRRAHSPGLGAARRRRCRASRLAFGLTLLAAWIRFDPCRALAVVGTSRSTWCGGPPRAGGGSVLDAARALRALGVRALVAVKCANEDRGVLAPPLIALGLPVLWLTGSSTATFSFRYSGDQREMRRRCARRSLDAGRRARAH